MSDSISYKNDNLLISEYSFSVPLDYDDISLGKINIFAREVRSNSSNSKSLPYLVYFQGGPGYESPKPISNSGWIKRAIISYRVLLLDQRGTGRSTPINSKLLTDDVSIGIKKVICFRADSIVKDAELIRQALIGNMKWAILGQSFGGFCAVHYLSFYPESLLEVFITGGMPPVNQNVDNIYRKTYPRVKNKNNIFYETFPTAHENAKKIANIIINNQIKLPNNEILTVERFQLLGLMLGFSDGMATLNYLMETAIQNQHLAYSFLKNLQSVQTFDTNPIFTVLHEACYAENFATKWSAHRMRSEFPEFNYSEANTFYFTGEMLYPWMLRQIHELRPYEKISNLIAEKKDWGKLYDKENLNRNEVPISAVIYTDDMYVDRDFSLSTSSGINRLRIWETDLYQHNGLRSNGEIILDYLIKNLK